MPTIRAFLLTRTSTGDGMDASDARIVRPARPVCWAERVLASLHAHGLESVAVKRSRVSATAVVARWGAGGDSRRPKGKGMNRAIVLIGVAKTGKLPLLGGI